MESVGNFWSIGLAALVVGCGSSPQVAGTGSQTGNSVVAGRIVGPDSTTGVPGVAVYLRPIDWTATDSLGARSIRETTTDSTGAYRFEDVPAAGYRLEARDGAQGWTRTVHPDGDRFEVPRGLVRPFGSLQVEFDPTDTVLGGLLQIYGIPRSTPIPSTATREFHLRFDSLSPGLHTVRIWSRGRVVCDAPVRIQAGTMTTLDFEEIDRPPGGPRDDDP